MARVKLKIAASFLLMLGVLSVFGGAMGYSLGWYGLIPDVVVGAFVGTLFGRWSAHYYFDAKDRANQTWVKWSYRRF